MMDSDDHSGNQLKAPDSGFSGFRSQSFSNLFQGFFGVKRAPASIADIPSKSDTSEDTIRKEGWSLEPIVSPSNEDSWILSHILHNRRERDNDSNLRRNVTWSELGKVRNSGSPESMTSASVSDVREGIGNEHLTSTVPQILMEEDSSSDPKSYADEAKERPVEPRITVAKNVEHSHYPRNLLSSFLSHELLNSEAKQKNDSDLQRSRHSEHHASTSASVPGVSSGTSCAEDQVDQTLVTSVEVPSAKLPESKHTIRDLLWSFNHEKINVSRKEMNLIASVDQ